MPKSNITAEIKKLDSFTKEYLIAALWSSNDDQGVPLDSLFDLRDIDADHLKQVKKDCMNFQQDNAALLKEAYKHIGYNSEQAGHDLWLTRNGHGAGYWDRGLGEVGQSLTEKAHALKQSDVYEGDDNKIYFTNLPFHRTQLSLKF